MAKLMVGILVEPIGPNSIFWYFITLILIQEKKTINEQFIDIAKTKQQFMQHFFYNS